MVRKAGAILAALTLAACGGPPPEAPSPAGGAVVPRHWDQACNATRARPTTMRVSELFDTVGLGGRLAHIGVKPLPLAPPWPIYDFITRYDARGRPVASGTWDATVDSTLAGALEEELRGRVRPLAGLLEPTGFRSQVVFARRVTFDLAGPVECLPHLVHEEGKRATGLPEDVTTWGGRGYVAPGDTRTALVKIHVDPTGAVSALEDMAGSPEALARVRTVIARLRFEPALSNGVPVPGTLLQGFRFRTPGG